MSFAYSSCCHMTPLTMFRRLSRLHHPFTCPSYIPFHVLVASHASRAPHHALAMTHAYPDKQHMPRLTLPNYTIARTFIHAQYYRRRHKVYTTTRHVMKYFAIFYILRFHPESPLTCWRQEPGALSMGAVYIAFPSLSVRSTGSMPPDKPNLVRSWLLVVCKWSKEVRRRPPQREKQWGKKETK